MPKAKRVIYELLQLMFEQSCSLTVISEFIKSAEERRRRKVNGKNDTEHHLLYMDLRGGGSSAILRTSFAGHCGATDRPVQSPSGAC